MRLIDGQSSSVLQSGDLEGSFCFGIGSRVGRDSEISERTSLQGSEEGKKTFDVKNRQISVDQSKVPP